MDIHWMKHRKAKVAHGFIQLGGIGVKPWIVSICRQVRFRPGDLTHQAHEVFTEDMRVTPEDFCPKCIERFSMAASKPKLQMKWPSVTCPECSKQAWLTDSVHIIVCERCGMNYAFDEPLYDKTPKVTNDQQSKSIERPRPTLVKGTKRSRDREQIQDVGDGVDRADGVGEEGYEGGDDTDCPGDGAFSR